MSVTTPAVAFAPNSLYNTTLSDETPILCESVSFGTLVDNPETAIVSLLDNVCDVYINALTWRAFFLTYTTFV